MNISIILNNSNAYLNYNINCTNQFLFSYKFIMYFLRNVHKIYIPMLSQSKCGGNRDNKKRCKRYIYRIVCTYIKLGILRLWRIQKQVSSSHHLNRVIFKSAFFEMISFHLSITTFLLLDYEMKLLLMPANHIPSVFNRNKPCHAWSHVKNIRV